MTTTKEFGQIHSSFVANSVANPRMTSTKEFGQIHSSFVAIYVANPRMTSTKELVKFTLAL